MYRFQLPNGEINQEYLNYFGSTHLLIAGTTGSGKSTLLNGILYSALGTNTPCDAEFCFIDPKKVELKKYKELPHTLFYDDNIKGINKRLYWANMEMDERYEYMQSKDLDKYPNNHLYIVIDELADLMISDYQRDIKRNLQRLLQLGRAANVHVIACTQAPSRKVIPAELTLNFTNRIALRCIFPIESKQIIGAKGAESLAKYGQAIYLDPDGLKKIDVPMIDKELILERINFWKIHRGFEIA